MGRLPSNRIVFVHIGTHKTGTTSLQELLAKNARAFARYGLLIPKAGRIEANSGHHNIAWELGADPRFDPAFGTLESLLREMACAVTRTACISSEDFELLHADDGALTRLRDGITAAGYTPKIVLYVRPQADYLESAYAEVVKARDVDFDDFFESIVSTGSFGPLLFAYDRLAHAFAAVFGCANLIVRQYRSALPSSALLTDFVALVAPELAHLDGLRLPPRLNPMAAFGDVIAARERHAGRHTAHTICKAQRFDPLTSLDIARIIARFSRSNDRLGRDFGVKVACATSDIIARELLIEFFNDRDGRQRKHLIRTFSGSGTGVRSHPRLASLERAILR